MNIKNSIISVFTIALMGTMVPQAQALSMPPAPQLQVSAITATSASVSLSEYTQNLFTQEEKAQTYIEYFETEQVCIMIYPTPQECLPKKLPQGVLTGTLTNLKPNTSYTVVFKRDPQVACFQAPCNAGEFQSSETVFRTASSTPAVTFTRYMTIGSRGADVTALQTILAQKGYLKVAPTGYYGALTRAAVHQYQRNEMNIISTGTVGPLTRAHLNSR